jgi:hypothetical protein
LSRRIVIGSSPPSSPPLLLGIGLFCSPFSKISLFSYLSTLFYLRFSPQKLIIKGRSASPSLWWFAFTFYLFLSILKSNEHANALAPILHSPVDSGTDSSTAVTMNGSGCVRSIPASLQRTFYFEWGRFSLGSSLSVMNRPLPPQKRRCDHFQMLRFALLLCDGKQPQREYGRRSHDSVHQPARHLGSGFAQNNILFSKGMAGQWRRLWHSYDSHVIMHKGRVGSLPPEEIWSVSFALNT